MLTRPILRQVDKPPFRQVDLIVVHCSATPSGKSIEQGLRGKPGYLNAPKVIDVWHAARGFKRAPDAVRAFNPSLPSIGYHYVIDLTGEVWSGRSLDEIGAHAQNFNANSVGICLVGGAERDAKYTPAQWKSLQQVVTMLCTDYSLPRAFPRRIVGRSWPAGYTLADGVCGHRDLSPDSNGNGLVEPSEWLKTCPGFDVKSWLERGMVPELRNIYTPESSQ